MTAGPEVKRFDEIKVGDFVVVRYMESLTLELKKGGAGIRESSEKEQTARRSRARARPAARRAASPSSPTWSRWIGRR